MPVCLTLVVQDTKTTEHSKQLRMFLFYYMSNGPNNAISSDCEYDPISSEPSKSVLIFCGAWGKFQKESEFSKNM